VLVHNKQIRKGTNTIYVRPSAIIHDINPESRIFSVTPNNYNPFCSWCERGCRDWSYAQTYGCRNGLDNSV